MADTIKRKRGPEPLPQSDKRSKRLNIFFNAAEYQRLLDEASLAGITPSDLMRLKFIDGPSPAAALVVPELNLGLYAGIPEISVSPAPVPPRAHPGR